MRILVTGACGQLGRDAVNELAGRGHRVIGSDLAPEGVVSFGRYLRLDVADRAAVERTLAEIAPDAVVHCAAVTAVDWAEYNTEKAHAVNAVGTESIATACKKLDCKMIYLSTDYVFDGRGAEPWQADSKDCKPINAYGRSKLAGEMAVAGHLERFYIVRTSWLFGVHGSNFVKAMLSAGKARDMVHVVHDQIGAPTYTRDLACLLADMIETEQYGCYHATNEGGYLSRFDFASEIFRQAGLSTKVIPVSTAEYGSSKAARPLNGRLDTRKLAEKGFHPLPDWRDALRRYLRAAKQDDR